MSLKCDKCLFGHLDGPGCSSAAGHPGGGCNPQPDVVLQWKENRRAREATTAGWGVPVTFQAAAGASRSRAGGRQGDDQGADIAPRRSLSLISRPFITKQLLLPFFCFLAGVFLASQSECKAVLSQGHVESLD